MRKNLECLPIVKCSSTAGRSETSHRLQKSDKYLRKKDMKAALPNHGNLVSMELCRDL